MHYRNRAKSLSVLLFAVRVSALLRKRFVFERVTVLRLCERDDAEHARPPLSAVDVDGVIFREDFDSTDNISQLLWLV